MNDNSNDIAKIESQIDQISSMPNEINEENHVTYVDSLTDQHVSKEYDDTKKVDNVSDVNTVFETTDEDTKEMEVTEVKNQDEDYKANELIVDEAKEETPKEEYKITLDEPVIIGVKENYAIYYIIIAILVLIQAALLYLLLK